MAQGAESQQERNSWSGQRAILPCAPIRSFLCLSASWSSLLILACRDSVACEPWDCYFDSGQTWCASQNNGAVRWCVCVCVCLSGERGRKGKEERGVCLGVHAVELCVCVCSRFACMKSDSWNEVFLEHACAGLVTLGLAQIYSTLRTHHDILCNTHKLKTYHGLCRDKQTLVYWVKMSWLFPPPAPACWLELCQPLYLWREETWHWSLTEETRPTREGS